MKADHFVDFIRVHVKAGDGGNGVVAFRREKYAPAGGPAGGRGGHGGNIYLEGDPELLTLLDLKHRPLIKARRGGHGEGSNKSGRSADDVVVRAPLGTQVLDADTGEVLGDITHAGERLLVAAGGRGGRGNESFATPSRRSPRKFEYGFPGEEKNLILELKAIADVGLVGLPNAGKSTLLAHLTRANPKIAPYPFTTIHPNLGVMNDEALAQTATIADIPGLIEGAHRGAGLGDRFLRHIERTQILVHLIAPESDQDPGTDTEREQLAQDLAYAYHMVRAELTQYSAALAQKQTLVCLNKRDLFSEATLDVIQRVLKQDEIHALPISAERHIHLDLLRAWIFERLQEQRRKEKPASLHEGESTE